MYNSIYSSAASICRKCSGRIFIYYLSILNSYFVVLNDLSSYSLTLCHFTCVVVHFYFINNLFLNFIFKYIYMCQLAILYQRYARFLYVCLANTNFFYSMVQKNLKSRALELKGDSI